MNRFSPTDLCLVPIQSRFFVPILRGYSATQGGVDGQFELSFKADVTSARSSEAEKMLILSGYPEILTDSTVRGGCT